MKTSDLIVMCIQNLRRRKFRTALTIIGVVIGTTAIISMISLGIGINKSTSDLISSWGDLSVIDVFSGGTEQELNDDMLSTISAMEGVDAITPFMNADISMQLFSGKKDRFKIEWSDIVGVYPDSLESLDYTLAEGTVKTSGTSGKKIPVLFGAYAAYSFVDTKRSARDNWVSPYPDEFGVVKDPFVKPLSDTFTLQIPYGENNTDKFLTYDLEVTGVLNPGDLEYSEAKYSIFMDVKDLKRMQQEYEKASKSKIFGSSKTNSYTRVRVKVNQLDLVSIVQEEINTMGFYTNSTEEQRQNALKSTEQMQVILGGLGAVSLLVAAISIANTMVMSVYERTREIGIMKVLGCFVEDIRHIFLVEAALIGFLGGVMGVLLSYAISFVLNNFGGNIGQAMGMMSYWGGPDDAAAKISVIPLWLVAVGMIFSTFIGVAAGFYPAARAVKISALEAIRQD